MKIPFLKKLLDLAEQYEADGGRTDAMDFEDFMSWILVRGRQQQPGYVSEALPQGPPVAGLISMYLFFMSRYAEFYSRRLFRHSEIYSIDDWGIMATLYPDQQLKKTAVIQGAIMEKSSGNEVLKRLLRQHFLEEIPHPTDRRSKLIALTPQGKEAFEALQNGISYLSNIVVADLKQEEQHALLEMLLKLHRYHQPVFEQADEKQLEKMLGIQP
jgi:DNA-binding MarR family transcriptional regulator